MTDGKMRHHKAKLPFQSFIPVAQSQISPILDSYQEDKLALEPESSCSSKIVFKNKNHFNM